MVWLCLNPCTCMPLRTWNIDMGYCWGLSVYCAEAPLPRFIAYSTCVHTLMCFLYICLLQSGKDPRTLCSLRMPL